MVLLHGGGHLIGGMNMEWERVIYDESRGYTMYVSGDYYIKRTHIVNSFTGKEMSPAHQKWYIFWRGAMVGCEQTLKEAKRKVEMAEKMTQ